MVSVPARLSESKYSNRLSASADEPCRPIHYASADLVGMQNKRRRVLHEGTSLNPPRQGHGLEQQGDISCRRGFGPHLGGLGGSSPSAAANKLGENRQAGIVLYWQHIGSLMAN